VHIFIPTFLKSKTMLMKKLSLVFLSGIFFNAAMAQQNAWSSHLNTATITKERAVSRLSFPTEFKLFDVNIAPLQQELYKVVGNAQSHSAVISMPNAEGQMEQFEIFEASNFEPRLQARFPQIRAFSGRGITDKSASLKLSYSPQGVQGTVFRTGKENEIIEPYSQDHTVYAVFKSRRNLAGLPWACTTPQERLAASMDNNVANASLTGRSGANLKTMRLAQSVTAEYSNYFGATSSSQVALVLAAVNATMTRCNGVYEKDLAIHLNLVSNTTSVFYYSASTDPYSAASTGAGGAWNSELQSTLTSVIGEANYDIGHLFGASGGGGNAGCIGCVCTNNSKGSGYTSPADGIPAGDNFDIDYVVHEVGHQLGANHTFSMSNEGTGVNKEVGSGITIMGYAGITNQDVAPHSIDIFHQASIAQIQTNINSKTCPVTTTIVNSTPVVAALSNYTIPKSTPFALTGSATDANAGDVLTYCWEQNDNASSSQTNGSSIASIAKASGPNWISFAPTTSPTRYFPKLSTILAGLYVTPVLTGGDAGTNIEALSSVSRTLNFRLTVRDNAPYSSTAPISVGQTQFTDMAVTVTSGSGPFAVSVPNTAVSYAGNSTQTITWAVASTTASPVSCANVKISLSTDGGQTFPTVLAASTANDGTEALVIPNTPTTTARIKVEAVGNIFFDISNANFTITAGSACGTATGLASSSITTTSANVSWGGVSGATSYAVDYKLNSSGTWTSFATAQTATTASFTGLASGSLHDWRIIATCASGVGAAAAAQFTTQAVCVAPAGLSSTPAATTATVSWGAVTAATSYAVEYKLNSDIAWTSFSTAQAGTSASLTGLTASTLYDWRVSATCPSGTTTATQAQFTTTAVPVCNAPTGLSSTPASTTASVSWTAASGAVSYKVEYKLNSSGTWTTFSTAQTGVSASLTGLTASTLYDWRVTTNCSSGSSTAAAAQFTTTAAPTCPGAYDVSTNGTVSGAALIPFNTDIKGLISPSGDNDYYRFVITTGGTATLTLTTLPGDYDVIVYSSNGTTQLAISQNGSTTSETISRTYTAGTYYARVYGYNGANSSTVCYTLKVALGTAAREADIAPAYSSKKVLTVYPNPAQSTLNINLTGYEGVSSISLMDINGKQVAVNRTAQVNSKMDISKLAKGIYLVKVVTAGGEVLNTKVVKQ
jgi:hypothetical protein